MKNMKTVTINGTEEKICSFMSKYLEKTYYIRSSDLKKSQQQGRSTVKYCKSNGQYHVEKRGEPLRLVHISNLDNIQAMEF